MLTRRETETIRAALQFWREEICPHGEATARPYLDADDVSPLNSDEVEKLRDQFARSAVRYAILTPDQNGLQDVALITSTEEAKGVAGEARVATVILPAA